MKAPRYVIGDGNIALIKKGCMLINTSRGGLINTKSVIKALKNRTTVVR